MHNKYNRVVWIFSHPNPNDIPSYVVGGIMPANYLGVKKLIFLENHDPEKTILTYNPTVLIISKVFHKNVINLVNFARSKKIKIIAVFDDWNFDITSKTDNTKRNLPIAIKSDFIVVKTKTASRVLYENTNLKSFVVPDMVRYQSNNVITKITYPFKISWFGMSTNHETLINELKDIDAKNLKINLIIITNFISEIKLKITSIKLVNINVKYVEWHEQANKEIIKSEIVILPYPNDKERLVKSSNRIIDALNLGRFVILSNVNQFEEFKNYTYFGDISEGLIWIKSNHIKALNKIEKGQKYVIQNYSENVVSSSWAKIIDTALK